MSITDPNVYAVLTPWQLERFRDLFGLAGTPLTADFTGWHKHVLVAPDRVFLFPRNHLYVPDLEHELAVYAAFSRSRIEALPCLLGRYQDAAISPYPFGAVTRLTGVRYGLIETDLTLQQEIEFLMGLGELIGQWHNMPASEIPPLVRNAPRTDAGKEDWARNALMVDRCREAVSWLHGELQRLCPGRLPLRKWQECLIEFAALPSVLVHGDLHEDQILVENAGPLSISGILDWECARWDHPAWDFDFREWGAGIWEREEHFAELRQAM